MRAHLRFLRRSQHTLQMRLAYAMRRVAARSDSTGRVLPHRKELVSAREQRPRNRLC